MKESISSVFLSGVQLNTCERKHVECREKTVCCSCPSPAKNAYVTVTSRPLK